jgi:hypothetical protein
MVSASQATPQDEYYLFSSASCERGDPPVPGAPDEGNLSENKYAYDLDEPLGCDPK